jgi:hypothetical protein
MTFETVLIGAVLFLGAAPVALKLDTALRKSAENAITPHYGRHETWRRPTPGSKARTPL